MSTARGRSAVRGWVRMLAGPSILLALAYTLDLPSILARLATLRPGWALLAVLLGFGQTLLLAWRWRYTAGRLGLDLSLGSAVSEYYLAVFLNQVLPGGVAGDAARAWRHAGRSSASGAAVRAVVLERASGQVVMILAAALSVSWIGARTGRELLVLAGLATLVGLGVALVWVRARAATAGRASVWARLADDAAAAVLSPPALRVQVPVSVVVVGSYLATYVCAARAVGIDTPTLVLGPLVAPVLMAMLVPITLAGWGVREAAAAGIWAGSGLGAPDGVAISVAYGLLVLVGTLPGAAVLVVARYGERSGTRPRRSRSNSTS